LLAALCLCLYVPGLAHIPVLDRDEARFAEATRQMLESGDFLRIRFQNEARNNKPAGIYWLQAVAVSALSTSQSIAIWPYRVPSLLGASLAAMLTYGFGRALLRGAPDAPRTALIAAVLLASALGVVAEAHIAKTDAALLAAIVGGQGALGLCYVRARAGEKIGRGVAAAFWAAQIAAIFLKGPIGPSLAIVTAATLSVADRDARWLRGLRPVIGLIFTALVILPWLYAIEQATEGQFLEGSVGRDFLSKLLGGQEAHGAPPLYYLALALVTFWPGSLLLAPALIRGWRNRAQPAVRFLLAWVAPAWIALELVPTKLPHYALPLFPALALLAAGSLVDTVSARGWSRWLLRTNTILWGLATLALTAALIDLPYRFGHGTVIAGLLGAVALVILAAELFRRRPGPVGTTAVLAALSLAFVVSAAGWVVPSLDRLWLSRAAAALIAQHPPPSEAPIVVLGYNEPSLVFLLRNKMDGVAGLAAGDEALISAEQAAMFEQTLSARGLTAQPVDSVSGTDYSNGQATVLTLYRIGPR
jgi:4-amino-4-deoxy-L-arabinose transferase-like glycosyltransferase